MYKYFLVFFFFLFSSCFPKKNIGSYPAIMTISDIDGYYTVLLDTQNSNFIADFDANSDEKMYISISGVMSYKTNTHHYIQLDPVYRHIDELNNVVIIFRINSSNSYHDKYVRYLFTVRSLNGYSIARISDTYPIFDSYEDAHSQNSVSPTVTLFEW